MLFKKVKHYYKYENEFYLKPEIDMTSDTWSKLKKEKVFIGNYKASKVFALMNSIFTEYETQLISQLQKQEKSLLRNYSILKRERLKEWFANDLLDIRISVKWFETAKSEPTKPFIEIEVDYYSDKHVMRFVTKSNFPSNEAELKSWTQNNIEKLL